MEAITLQQQIERYKDIIPLSYIARKYFGKSKSWLYQRLYGYEVRGKVYELTPLQEQVLVNAIHDIASQLNSIKS